MKSSPVTRFEGFLILGAFVAGALFLTFQGTEIEASARTTDDSSTVVDVTPAVQRVVFAADPPAPPADAPPAAEAAPASAPPAEEAAPVEAEASTEPTVAASEASPSSGSEAWRTLRVTVMDNCVHCEAFEAQARPGLEAQGWLIERVYVQSGAPTFTYRGHVKNGFLNKDDLYAWLKNVTTGVQTEAPAQPERVVVINDGYSSCSGSRTAYSQNTVYSSCGDDWATPVEGYSSSNGYFDTSGVYHSNSAKHVERVQYQRPGFFSRVFGRRSHRAPAQHFNSGSFQFSGGCVNGMCR